LVEPAAHAPQLSFDGDAEFGVRTRPSACAPHYGAAASFPSSTADTGLMDSRMYFYRENQKKIPSIAGQVIPEPVYTRREYEEKILGPMYADIAPHDPDGILHNEWLNARGAIARFDRSAIEIRIIDVQECPAADMAIAHAITCVLRALVSEKWQPLERQKRRHGCSNSILVATTHTADGAVIRDHDYLEAFELRPRGHRARCGATSETVVVVTATSQARGNRPCRSCSRKDRSRDGSCAR
jgi:hypothetical protein